jgi:hypothetical protein
MLGSERAEDATQEVPVEEDFYVAGLEFAVTLDPVRQTQPPV